MPVLHWHYVGSVLWLSELDQDAQPCQKRSERRRLRINLKLRGANECDIIDMDHSREGKGTL